MSVSVILQDENGNVTGKKKLSETSTTPQSKQQKAVSSYKLSNKY